MLALLRASRIVPHSILRTSLSCGYCHRACFSNGETEAERGELTHQSHTANMEVKEKPVGLGAGWLPRGGSWPSHCPERSGREGLEEGSGVRQEVGLSPEEAGQACGAEEALGPNPCTGWLRQGFLLL